MDFTLLAYLVNLAIFAFFFLATKNYRYILATNFVLACFAVLQILAFLTSQLVAYYGGYHLGVMTFFDQTMGGYWFPYVAAQVGLWISPLLNFKYKFRVSWVFQTVIVIVYFGINRYLGASPFRPGEFLGEPPNGLESMGNPAYYIGYEISIPVFFALSILLVYFKVLPEFRKKEEDVIYDSLINRDDT